MISIRLNQNARAAICEGRESTGDRMGVATSFECAICSKSIQAHKDMWKNSCFGMTAIIVVDSGMCNMQHGGNCDFVHDECVDEYVRNLMDGGAPHPKFMIVPAAGVLRKLIADIENLIEGAE